jgi:hypothetical protein
MHSSGTFCECFGRCFDCHPLTEEEKKWYDEHPIEFKSVTLPLLKGGTRWPSLSLVELVSSVATSSMS